ncbi:MAG TPA: Sec-independent protein translocase protein TatB [Spongiibacteraceae bacterium]|nr:Sec-independent protein translocase protein TatB [Spongiibacteraceae bacterium]
MFDVSFSELVLILIVGLVVFGPEKLPEVVRTAGLWLSKLRRSFNHIRSEIEREVGMDELKRDIHNQGIMDSLKEVHNDLRKTQQDLSQLPRDVQNSLQSNIDTGHSTVPMEPFPQAATQPTPTPALTNTTHAEPTHAPLIQNEAGAPEPEHNHRPS